MSHWSHVCWIFMKRLENESLSFYCCSTARIKLPSHKEREKEKREGKGRNEKEKVGKGAKKRRKKEWNGKKEKKERKGKGPILAV